MITLSTGLPGHGKTLYTITVVKEMSERDGRPVFYYGIQDLSLPWTVLENPEKWFECPTGSIVVIDECQKVFRPRGSSVKPPDYVTELETHRHKGLDLFFITQHPMLIDGNVRRLVERHLHICRRFGFNRSIIFQYESCKDQPLSKTSQAQKSNWNFPKNSYEFYKSAEIHTVKKRVPKVAVFLFMSLVLLFILGYVFYERRYANLGKLKSKTSDLVSMSDPLSKPVSPTKTDDFFNILKNLEDSERWRLVGWFETSDNRNVIILRDSNNRTRFIDDVKSFNKKNGLAFNIYLPNGELATRYSGIRRNDFNRPNSIERK